VAAPLAWRDVEDPDLGPRDYTIENVFRRIGGREDPWQGLRRRAHAIAPAADRLGKLRDREDD
jgi:bifunctional non-homologous end joining protein LigD